MPILNTVYTNFFNLVVTDLFFRQRIIQNENVSFKTAFLRTSYISAIQILMYIQIPWWCYWNA